MMGNEVQVYSITDEYMRSHHIKTLSYALIENLIYFLCVYPIVSIINNIIDSNEKMLYSNLISIIPVLFITFLRYKIKTLSKFVMIILLVAIAWLLLLSFFKQYIFMIYFIIWVILSLKRSTKIQRFEFNKLKLLLAQILLIPQILLAAGLELKNFQNFICFLSIFIMCISIGYICKARNIRLSLDDIENESFNRKDNNIFIGGTILLICIILLVLYKSGVFEAANYLTKKISNSLLNIGKENIGQYNNEFQSLNNGNDINEMFKLNNESIEPPGKIAQIISAILNIIFIVVSICISYLALNRMLIYIKMLRNKDKVTFVFTSKNENEIKKKISKIKNDVQKIIFLNDKEKIRRFYKDKILKYKRNNIIISSSSSTHEIQKEVFNKALDNIEDITKVYEKARYSNEQITQNDMIILKKYKK